MKYKSVFDNAQSEPCEFRYSPTPIGMQTLLRRITLSINPLWLVMNGLVVRVWTDEKGSTNVVSSL